MVRDPVGPRHLTAPGHVLSACPCSDGFTCEDLELLSFLARPCAALLPPLSFSPSPSRLASAYPSLIYGALRALCGFSISALPPVMALPPVGPLARCCGGLCCLPPPRARRRLGCPGPRPMPRGGRAAEKPRSSRRLRLASCACPGAGRTAPLSIPRTPCCAVRHGPLSGGKSLLGRAALGPAPGPR